MQEKDYETLLNINTSGEDKYHTSLHYHRYEPTPYAVLEQLFQIYPLHETDSIIDYGCGKGRLNFFIHHKCRASVTGIEMNEIFYRNAVENQASYFKKYPSKENKINFLCGLAEDYEIKANDNKFYFFNPFSIQIFRKIIENILISMELHPRCVDLILYYPSDEYIYYLEHKTGFSQIHDITFSNNHRNHRERLVVYQLSYL